MRFSVRNLAPVAAMVAVVAAPRASFAHYVWATVEKGQARFALLESIDEAPSAKFASYVTGLSPLGGGKKLAIGAPKDGATYASLPKGVGLVSAQSVVGAKERNGEKYLLVYDAKGADSLASAGAITRAPAELTLKADGDKLRVSVRQDGWPVPQSEVWVQWPGQENATSVQTDMRGEATVDWPAASTRKAGFVGFRALVSEAKPGVSEGKSYDSVHHWATLTFPVEGAKADATAKAATPALTMPDVASVPLDGKTVTQLMRASFGNAHEVVADSGFNETLFGGQMTKAQLITHLQQRALVHNEVHRILIGADASKPVPYGAAQKRVLVYLFEDLVNLGSGWPTEAQARPLTESFLQEIRDSEKRGPYFALGVQHVYYGGITNGGRMIGQKIGEMVKYTPTYYEKSDGYPEYLAEVNKLTDPDARREMMRGGQAAYRYIIASSNDPVFRPAAAGTVAASQ